MRILHVVEAAAGGVGRHVLDLCEGLLARGHEVHLAYSPVREDRFFEERLARLDGIRAGRVELRKYPHPSDLAGMRTIRGELRNGKGFDVVHGHSSKGGAVARLAALGAGVPAVYTPNAIRTMDPEVSGVTRRAVATVERLLARVDGAVIAVSPAEREHLARIGIPRPRLTMVPNCVRPVDLPSPDEARRRLGLPRDASVVGFVGRLARQKAPEVLLAAFARVARAAPDAVLAVIGDGPLRSTLHDQCERLDIGDRVRWLGERDGQLSMPAFDVLALPSRYEGLPHVLLEALLAGLPIVATKQASAGLAVDSGVNGLLVPVNEPDAVAEAVGRLLDNDEVRAEYGRASRFRAGRFSQARMVDETLDVYRKVVRDGRGTG